MHENFDCVLVVLLATHEFRSSGEAIGARRAAPVESERKSSVAHVVRKVLKSYIAAAVSMAQSNALFGGLIWEGIGSLRPDEFRGQYGYSGEFMIKWPLHHLPVGDVMDGEKIETALTRKGGKFVYREWDRRHRSVLREHFAK